MYHGNKRRCCRCILTGATLLLLLSQHGMQKHTISIHPLSGGRLDAASLNFTQEWCVAGGVNDNDNDVGGIAFFVNV